MIEPFVDIEWVRAHRDEVVLADSRWYADGRSGRDAYVGGHVPGAVFVDLDEALTRHEDAAVGGRHPLAEPEDFAAAMAALGVGDEDTVVAYDDAGGVIAARLVWMLRATGHEAALLDGGLAAWPDALETGDATECVRTSPSSVRESANAPVRGGFTVRAWPADRLASIDEVAAIASSGGTVLDARPADRFAGAPDDLDPRPGHIPGSRNVPCRENLDPSGRLLPVDDLRARFGVEDATEVISSCGSGVTACHNLLAMEHAGLGRGRLFPGSWSQWSRDPARPVQKGAG
ncbi:MAG: sulfurtransferase [Solirubrobacterales bacterium 70-9]|nr:MAG: sulfurtransferase [Solirubrobacterales bacterium 70-9]